MKNYEEIFEILTNFNNWWRTGKIDNVEKFERRDLRHLMNSITEDKKNNNNDRWKKSRQNNINEPMY